MKAAHVIRIPRKVILYIITFMMSLALLPCHAYNYRDNPHQCEANLRNISTALEMYATDNNHQYPPSLSCLMPNYLYILPTCPSLGIDTYSCGYRAGQKEYYVCCLGKNHAQLPDNQPAYDSKIGTIANPSTNYRNPDSEKALDTATSLVLLGILAVVSFLTYRKK